MHQHTEALIEKLSRDSNARFEQEYDIATLIHRYDERLQSRRNRRCETLEANFEAETNQLNHTFQLKDNLHLERFEELQRQASEISSEISFNHYLYLGKEPRGNV